MKLYNYLTNIHNSKLLMKYFHSIIWTSSLAHLDNFSSPLVLFPLFLQTFSSHEILKCTKVSNWIYATEVRHIRSSNNLIWIPPITNNTVLDKCGIGYCWTYLPSFSSIHTYIKIHACLCLYVIFINPILVPFHRFKWTGSKETHSISWRNTTSTRPSPSGFS